MILLLSMYAILNACAYKPKLKIAMIIKTSVNLFIYPPIKYYSFICGHKKKIVIKVNSFFYFNKEKPLTHISYLKTNLHV